MVLLILIALLSLRSAESGTTKECHDTYKLLHQNITDELIKYGRQLPPIHNDEETGEGLIYVMWLVGTLVNVNENSNTFTIQSNYRVIYQHMTVNWKLQEHCNITRIMWRHENIGMIWQPSMELDNLVEEGPSLSEAYAVMYNEGQLSIWYEKRAITLYCEFSAFYYPFDTQLCTSQLQVTAGKANIPISTFCAYWYKFDGATWKILSCSTTILRQAHDPYMSAAVDMHILLERKPAFFVMTVLLPTVVLLNIVPIIFIIPAHSPQKTTIGMTLVVAFFVFMANITRQLPPGGTTAIHIYVTTGLIFQFGATFAGSLCQRLKLGQAKRLNRSAFVVCVFIASALDLMLFVCLSLAPGAKCTYEIPDDFTNSVEPVPACSWSDKFYNVTYSLVYDRTTKTDE